MNKNVLPQGEVSIIINASGFYELPNGKTGGKVCTIEVDFDKKTRTNLKESLFENFTIREFSISIRNTNTNSIVTYFYMSERDLENLHFQKEGKKYASSLVVTNQRYLLDIIEDTISFIESSEKLDDFTSRFRYYYEQGIKH